MTCYAWRKGGKAEELCEHLLGTYEVAKRTWELEALSRKVSKLTGLDAEECREAILAAALLHDVGKAAVEYQVECAKGCCESFPGHYLVSTLYAYVTVKEGLGIAAPRDYSRLARILSGKESVERGVFGALLILLPVALHHYHQILSYQSLRYQGDEECARARHTVHAACHPCLKKLAEFIKSSFSRLNGLEKVGELPQLLSRRETLIQALIFVQNLGDAMRCSEASSLSLAIEAAAGIVNLSDGEVAAKARR
jgi:CRISPR-associated endonuclease Cas3-HD